MAGEEPNSMATGTTAYFVGRAVVSSDTGMFQAPDVSSTKVARICRGDIVSIFGDEHDFYYHVRLDVGCDRGTIGWVEKAAVTFITTRAVALPYDAKVFQGPDASSVEIARIFKGNIVSVLGEESGFYYIHIEVGQACGTIGWVEESVVSYIDEARHLNLRQPLVMQDGKERSQSHPTPLKPKSSITKNASWAVVAFMLLFALALVLGNFVLLTIGLFIVLVVLLGLLISTPSQVGIEREIGKTTVFVEDNVTIHWEITVKKGIGPVFVYDTLPEEIELVSGNNYRVFWKGRGEARFSNSYTIRCPKRGNYQLVATSWESRQALEFRQSLRGAASEALELSVVPRVLAIRRICNVRGLSKTPVPMMDLARVGVATTDFKEIREYVVGDPVRIINWKATARAVLTGSGRPLVNQYELEGKKAVWLFFDASEYMAVGTTLSSPLEHAIEAASGLSYYYLKRGYHLGAHFSSRPGHMLYPEAGNQQFHRLVREMLTLKPCLAKYDLKQAIHLCRAQLAQYSPLCVIFTRLDAATRDAPGIPLLYEDLFSGIRGLLAFSYGARRRISIWVVAVNGYNYVEGNDPVTEVGITVRAMQTRPLALLLRQMGVSVLEWNPFHEEFAQVLLRQIRLEKS